MRKTWRKISRLFQYSWSINLQYRGDLALWLLAMSATPLLSFAIWYSVANSNNASFATQDVVTYYILIILVRILTASWRGYELSAQILNGTVVQYLVRPAAILGEYITTPLTTKVMQLGFPLLLFLAILWFRPQTFSATIFEPSNIFLFFLSLLLAYVLQFAFDMSLGLLAFWLEDAHELMSYRFLLTEFASGIIIPFALMPSWLYTSLSFLPTRYVVSAPVEILLGQVQGTAAWSLIAIQISWVLGFVLLGRFLFKRGLRRYAIPGQ